MFDEHHHHQELMLGKRKNANEKQIIGEEEAEKAH